MYIGINLKLNELNLDDYDYQRGNQYLHARRNKILSELETIMDPYSGIGNISAKKIEENWFPSTKSHIFISHSHQDEKLITKLVGKLHSGYDLDCFVDSGLWSCVYDLQSQLEKKYADDEKAKRAIITNTNMILSVALAKMIDNTECLMFINTPQSISYISEGDITHSPWIYNELVISKLIRRRELKEYRNECIVHEYKMFEEMPKFEFKIDLEHLVNMSEKDLLWWIGLDDYGPESALDSLYARLSNNKGKEKPLWGVGGYTSPWDKKVVKEPNK